MQLGASGKGKGVKIERCRCFKAACLMNEMQRETAELAGILNKVYKCNCKYVFYVFFFFFSPVSVLIALRGFFPP